MWTLGNVILLVVVLPVVIVLLLISVDVGAVEGAQAALALFFRLLARFYPTPNRHYCKQRREIRERCSSGDVDVHVS